MNQNSTELRLSKFLQANAAQKIAIDKILGGGPIGRKQQPLLLKLGDGAKLLGVSRATLWRMIKSGKIVPVEILPGTHRVSRADLEALVMHDL